MDGLDCRIMREFIWGLAVSPLPGDLRMSLGDLARKLGTDEGTVRNRIRNYHKSGFIRGWRTILNPVTFGGRELAVYLDVGGAVSKEEALEAARLLPGVILINCFHGQGLEAILRYRDEAAAKQATALFLRLVRAERYILGRIEFPPCELSLTSTDLAILRCLWEKPRKPAVDVAREAGVSARTVRRRLQRMVDHQALFAFPALDPKAVKDALMAGLLVTYPADRKRDVDEVLARELDDHLWHTLHMRAFAPAGYLPSFYSLFLPNLAKAREVLRRAHDTPGVAECRLELFEEIETHFEAFDGELDLLAAEA